MVSFYYISSGIVVNIWKQNNNNIGVDKSSMGKANDQC